MKSYSINLGQKIVNAYAAGGISQKQVAINFASKVTGQREVFRQRKNNIPMPREPGC
jgi:transposase